MEEGDQPLTKHEFEHLSRIGKLDSALLFLTSAISIIFGMFQILLGYIPALIRIIPALILGWFGPFYVGYLHGAIRTNTPVDRARGWVYLIFGTANYGVIIFIELVPIIPLSFLIGFCSACFLTIFSIILPCGVFSLYNRSPSASEQYGINITVVAVFLLSLGLWLITEFVIFFQFSSRLLIGSLIMGISLLVGWGVYEFQHCQLARHSYSEKPPSMDKIWKALVLFTVCGVGISLVSAILYGLLPLVQQIFVELLGIGSALLLIAFSLLLLILLEFSSKLFSFLRKGKPHDEERNKHNE